MQSDILGRRHFNEANLIARKIEFRIDAIGLEIPCHLLDGLDDTIGGCVAKVYPRSCISDQLRSPLDRIEGDRLRLDPVRRGPSSGHLDLL